MGCIIDGERCTKCCEAITLPFSRKKLLEGARKFESPDAIFILANWKPMSKRAAKKKNPYLFRRFPKLRSRKHWSLYSCKALTADGCSKYNERPNVCSGYPFYGKPPTGGAPDYHPNCTEWVMIPSVEITAPQADGQNQTPASQ